MATEKEYYLWLDESGKFEEKERETWVAPSLIGGVLCDKEFRRLATPLQIRLDVKNNRQYAQAKQEYQQQVGKPLDFRHATELPAEIKTMARYDMMTNMYKKGYQFVIFQNEAKIGIVDTTKTYLNILAEGIAQLLADLSTNESVFLHIIIGARRDMEKSTAEQTVYTQLTDYAELIKERVILARTKLRFNPRYSAKYALELGNDKADDFLVLSDYVCSTWFTLHSRYYDVPIGEESTVTIREQIKGYFQEKGHFYQIFENETKIKVRRYIAEQNYASAFLELFVNEEMTEYEHLIREGFERLSDRRKIAHLQMFYEGIRALIEEQREYNMAIQLIKKGLAFMTDTSIEPLLGREYEVNLYLFLMSAYAHLGQQEEFRVYSERCNEMLPSLLRRQENFALYVIYKNRMVVYYQDLCEYEKSIEEGQDLLLLSDVLLENTENLKKVIDYESETYMEQRAKICGSLALSYQFCLHQKKAIAGTFAEQPEEFRKLSEVAREVSDEAIRNFSLHGDRCRQFQIRSEIEAETGEFEGALTDLLLSLMPKETDGKKRDIGKLKPYMDWKLVQKYGAENLLAMGLERIEKNEITAFEWYHITKILAILWEEGEESQLPAAKYLYQLIKDRAGVVLKERYFPVHCIAWKLGVLHATIGKERKKARECFTRAMELCKQEQRNSVFSMIAVGIMADEIRLCAQD